MTVYKPYFLRDNPFPLNPTLDPEADDIRINGSIFNEEIFEQELTGLRQRVETTSPLLVVYVQNLNFERGVGKSALIAYEWRKLRKKKNVTSVYLRCRRDDDALGFAVGVMRCWHEDGHLWKMFEKCMRRYTRLKSAEISADEVTKLFKEHRYRAGQVPRKVNLARTLWWGAKPEKFKQHFTDWLCSKTRAQLELIEAFLDIYLDAPRQFTIEYPKRIKSFRKPLRLDEIDSFRTFLELMKMGGHKYHFIFLDQFEDCVEARSGASLVDFSVNMRRFLEACINQAVVIVTLHPGAHQALDGQEGQELCALAPLDPRYLVDVESIEAEEAEKVAITYLERFREGDAPTPLYPFSADGIHYLQEFFNGNIRDLLIALHLSIKKGTEMDNPPIDLSFIKQHHQEITGRVDRS